MARKRLPPQIRSFPSPGRDLLIVDQEPIRRRALEAFETATRELEQLREIQRLYEERDRPAFSSWIHGAFHSTLGRIRGVFAEIDEKKQLILEVEKLAEEQNISFAEAYQAVFRKRAEEKEAAEKNPTSAEEEGFEQQGFEFSQDSYEQHASHEHEDDPLISRRKILDPASDILKRLYRDLARRLHPDTRGSERETAESKNLSDPRDALWLEVQKAYESRDLGRMQGLSLICRGLEGKETQTAEPMAGASIGELITLSATLRKAAKALQKELRLAELDPAWGFASSGANKHLRSQTKRELQEELREAHDALKRLNELIEALFEAA